MRRRYRYIRDARTGTIVEREVTAKATPAAGRVLRDIAEFCSPIDGSVISSRSTLREHERRYGVRQCGELTSATDFDWQRRSPGSPCNSYWSDYE